MYYMFDNNTRKKIVFKLYHTVQIYCLFPIIRQCTLYIHTYTYYKGSIVCYLHIHGYGPVGLRGCTYKEGIFAGLDKPFNLNGKGDTHTHTYTLKPGGVGIYA